MCADGVGLPPDGPVNGEPGSALVYGVAGDRGGNHAITDFIGWIAL